VKELWPAKVVEQDELTFLTARAGRKVHQEIIPTYITGIRYLGLVPPSGL
jgi:hypothetical protein